MTLFLPVAMQPPANFRLLAKLPRRPQLQPPPLLQQLAVAVVAAAVPAVVSAVAKLPQLYDVTGWTAGSPLLYSASVVVVAAAVDGGARDAVGDY